MKRWLRSPEGERSLKVRWWWCSIVLALSLMVALFTDAPFVAWFLVATVGTGIAVAGIMLLWRSRS
jgi:hypothetical protein